MSNDDKKSLLEPDWEDVPEDNQAEPEDAGGDHDGLPPEED